MVRPCGFPAYYGSESTRLPPPTGAILWVAACYFAGFGAILDQSTHPPENLSQAGKTMRSDFGRNQRNKPAAAGGGPLRAVLYSLYYFFNISKSSIFCSDLDHPASVDESCSPRSRCRRSQWRRRRGDLFFHAVIQFIISGTALPQGRWADPTAVG